MGDISYEMKTIFNNLQMLMREMSEDDADPSHKSKDHMFRTLLWRREMTFELAPNREIEVKTSAENE